MNQSVQQNKRKLEKQLTGDEKKSSRFTKSFQYIQSIINTQEWTKQEYESCVQDINSHQPFLL